MALIKPKTRKKITKPIRKLIKRHGRDVAIELITTLVLTMNTDGGDKTKKQMKKKLKKAKTNGEIFTEVATNVVSNLATSVLPDAITGGRKKTKKGDGKSDE